MKSPAYEIHCRFNPAARAAANGVDIHSTMEKLEMSRAYRIAVIPYHDFVICGIQNGASLRPDFAVAVYRFDSEERDIEATLTMLNLFDDFDDMGEAVRYGFMYVETFKAQEIMKGRC